MITANQAREITQISKKRKIKDAFCIDMLSTIIDKNILNASQAGKNKVEINLETISKCRHFEIYDLIHNIQDMTSQLTSFGYEVTKISEQEIEILW